MDHREHVHPFALYDRNLCPQFEQAMAVVKSNVRRGSLEQQLELDVVWSQNGSFTASERDAIRKAEAADKGSMCDLVERKDEARSPSAQSDAACLAQPVCLKLLMPANGMSLTHSKHYASVLPTMHDGYLPLTRALRHRISDSNYPQHSTFAGRY